MLNCIAVDDEKLVLDLLVDNIQQVPFLRLVKACRNAMEAAAVLQQQPVDLIFLDIQMPGLNGLQFLQTLPDPPLVIFVTAYKEYAIEGFNVNAIDYLLKPVSFERFLKACNKAQQQYNLLHAAGDGAKALPDSLFVYVEYDLVQVALRDIRYIEGMKDYIRIYTSTSSKPVMTKMSMKAVEEKLAAHKFARIHKSYIVAVDKITTIKRSLVVMDKEELPLSEHYKQNLEKYTK
jgi:DNA-binding LytR/AlgR family response regulator